MRKKAFTLVELLIVISILGIMAAIVLPTFQGHLQKTREVAAKDNLRILRTAIERYKVDHNSVCPGYIDGLPIADFLISSQLTSWSAINGDYAAAKAGIYVIAPYLSEMPENPFNQKSTLTLVDTPTFPDPASETTGWYYKPSTGEIRINTDGLDSDGMSFADY
ncbi:MAG: prepilin-type N-terminal cleavage/methylation domain-containing protein [Planctomycetes bacterium]|nr:prepilin-type N-terminal cleavage/methylation domain-containing protein [Planctomycetota bacterium]